MTRGVFLGRVALAFAVVLGLMWPWTAEASVSRDVSLKADRFARLPALPTLSEGVLGRAKLDGAVDDCVALCRFAASVEAAPFGYVHGRRRPPQGSQFTYDDTSLLAEFDANGNEVAKYDYGGDRLIRLTRADEGTRYMTFDGLGSVTGLTDTTGAVTATYHLDAWGNYRFTSELTTSYNRFGFTGHYWDKEASLYYAKARYYDPFTARFTQADSFLGTIDDPPSLHRYQYANDNPTMYVDEDGHSATALGAAVGFGWGVGQAIGGFWDDTFRGDYRRSFRDYASVVAQNTIAGAELGLAVDLTVASGGAAALPGVGAPVRAGIGALIGAGVSGLSVSGKDQAWGDFATNQAVGAGAGAAIGLVPELGIAASAVGVYRGAQTIKEGNAASAVVGASEIAASLLPYAKQEGRQLAFGRLQRLTQRAAGKLNEGWSWLTDLHSPGRLAAQRGAIVNPFAPKSAAVAGGADIETGRGYSVNDPPVRIDGKWSVNDMKQALLGHPPRGLGSPDLHHADQMPGSAIHEVLPSQHRTNPALHPNKFNQGVTPEMREADRRLHWWYRAREQGADKLLPSWIYDPD